MGDPGHYPTRSVQSPPRRKSSSVKPNYSAEPLLFLEDLIPPEIGDDLLAFHASYFEPGRVSGTDGVPVEDPSLKRRDDAFVDDRASVRIHTALKAATKIITGAVKAHSGKTPGAFESYRIGRYRPGDVFEEHVDDERPKTETRRFAFVTCLYNNIEDESGTLVFPDLGVSVSLRVGSSILFPCHLRHRVVEVSEGERFILATFIHAVN